MRSSVLALAFSSCCFAGPDGQSDEELTREMRDRIAAAMPEATVTIAAEPRLVVVAVGDNAAQLSFDNLALQCANTPEDCEANKQQVIRSTAEVFAAMGEEEAARPEQIRAVLHDRSWIESVEAAATVHRPFAADLVVVYVVDYPTTIASLSPETQAELHLDDAALDELALRNMDGALASFPIQPLEGSPGVSVLHAGDSYEAARVLLHDRWQPMAQSADGDLIVSVPCRDQVLFGGSDDLAALRSATDRIFSTEHHAISRRLLRWTPTGWEAYD